MEFKINDNVIIIESGLKAKIVDYSVSASYGMFYHLKLENGKQCSLRPNTFKYIYEFDIGYDLEDNISIVEILDKLNKYIIREGFIFKKDDSIKVTNCDTILRWDGEKVII